MDGLASCHTATLHLQEVNEKYLTIPISYDDDIDELLYTNEVTHIDTLLFVDFCPSIEWLKSNVAQKFAITVIDHHETAMKDIEKATDLHNVRTYFDMTECGASLVHKVLFKSNKVPEIIQYVKDRDLWKWSLPSSREVSEALRLLVSMNDVNSFNEAMKTPIKDLASIGSLLLKFTTKRVTEAITNVQHITIEGTDVVVLNTTSYQSEIGNALCTKYNKPSATYSISTEGTVWWSFRSLDSLPPVNGLAKSLGGGGHRNAAGATTQLHNLHNVLKFNNGEQPRP